MDERVENLARQAKAFGADRTAELLGEHKFIVAKDQADQLRIARGEANRERVSGVARALSDIINYG